MLLILTTVLGYELKMAVGTSVFIMAFTAFTGAVSHFAIGGQPDWMVFILCVVFTLIWARIAAVFANKATPTNPQINPIQIPLMTDWMARFCADTLCMVSLVVITGRTINLIPSKNVIKTEKFPIVADGSFRMRNYRMKEEL